MEWNTSWSGSVQPRKQRAYRRNAPLNVKGNLLASHLAKDLREKHRHRALRVRVGDKVKVMRGTFKGKSGKIERINTIRQQLFITGIEFTKRDGSKAMYPVHPSNVLIHELAPDKRRLGGVKQ